MKNSVLVAMALSGIVSTTPPATAAERGGFSWPHGARAAVSLAYDDALASQLDNAVPALDRRGFKGSFYLTLANDTVRTRLVEWRAIAANGHELGNHTLFHQCRGSVEGRDWVTPQRDLDKTTVAQMKDQVLLANAMLHAIDGKTERTMTAPCGERNARDGDYLNASERQFVAIKSVGGAVTLDMAALDPYAVPVAAPEGVTGAQLIAEVEAAAKAGTMVNFTFHGIGGDYLAVSTQAHEQLLAYLDAHRDVYWVATFIDIMRHVKAETGVRAAFQPD